jgi:hypothetical protein
MKFELGISNAELQIELGLLRFGQQAPMSEAPVAKSFTGSGCGLETHPYLPYSFEAASCPRIGKRRVVQRSDSLMHAV